MSAAGSPPLLDVDHVGMTYSVGGFFRRRGVRAVDDVSLRLEAGKPEILAIIGESGSGKTTLARMILNMVSPSAGAIRFRGTDLGAVRGTAARLAFMRQVQPIFQNPFEAFNPMKRVDRYLFATARHMAGLAASADIEAAADRALRDVGLSLAEVRRRYPQAEMLMGVGNLTELTSADSTGVNALLIAVCQELGVRSVLTTEVIPWARGAVREIDVARRLMHYAVGGRTLPKGIDDRLVTVKDPVVLTYSEAELRALQKEITDPNFRIFADRDAITVFNHERFVRGTDIQAIFAQLEVAEPTHAFYLGKELARASLAVTLGKTYRQEGTLQWGYLTPPDDAKAEHVTLTQRATRRRQPGARM